MFSTAQISAAFRTAGELIDVLSSGLSSARRSLISAIVQRVIVTKGHLRIEIKPFQLCAVLSDEIEPLAAEADSKSNIELEVKFDSSNRGLAVLAEPTEGTQPRPDAVLIKAIARARAWFDQLVTGKAKSMAEIAVSENITDNYISNLIHLAWLPPRQIERIFEGDAIATKLARIAMLNRRVDPIWTTTPLDP